MKRYFYIAIIAGFVASCTNDSAEEFLPQNKKTETVDFSYMERDTITNTTNADPDPDPEPDPDPDTGGQGGSTPIKPPKP